MALHDTYARRTPFELAFPEPERAERLAAEVAEEAQARGVDAHHPQMFATLGSVGAFLAELRGPDSPPEAMQQYAALAFHGVHFARAGFPVYLLGTGVTRRLVAGAPGQPREPSSIEPPSAAGYLQLPQHLFWVEAGEEEVPESVDGMFWTLTPDGMIYALIVTGVRPDRPGLGVIPIPEAPLADAEAWLTAAVRATEEGEDFASTIPGASLDELYGIRTAGEPLKLLARFFSYIAAAPQSLKAHDSRSDIGPEGLAPSVFPFKRVTLDG
ncbi:MAG: hypothetical protein WD995_00780 [Gemmatimonadota bacterium]